jgi:hypothetical protein
MDGNDVNPEKQKSLIEVAEFGIVMVDNDVHQEKQ